MPLDTPSASTTLGDYLRHHWLPRKQSGWASGSQRHRRWTVDTLCDSRLVDRPIGELTVLEIERYFAERAAIPFPSTGHSTSAMTLRIYAHVIPGDDERTAVRAAQMFEAS